MPSLLMCAPDYYGVEYEINPWMDRRRAPDHPLAVRQWRALREVLEGAGASVELVQPVAGLPDMVFTANAGLVAGRQFVLSNFRHPERQGEAAWFARWFRERGLEVVQLPPDRAF